ncbi:uncharacterized protein J7T54_002350 [Emericellopsis cladophorae]|uniref:COP9 signalosome complex subunit 6 n=1 Tax=Emericellopsis cladophorae TaxID=2686198 RepID=A0A9P9Y1Y7_9HYPO|nr:uncharacterized protein J7T54_002350 [Emericellopsis cladophorae]KAI6782113.1 hypothetical protein J7T54_002350 [Emericellopsis cladophorae]
MTSHGAVPRQGANPFVSQAGSSELQVILHPLVLLTISDYISRHTLRGKTHPIVGGVLGQQNGREITIEHAFEVKMEEGNNTVAEGWFAKRLEQMKLVHKDRQLDLVGWFTLLPSSGPNESILPVHRFFLANYNESAILLAFHPDQVLNHSAGGKLPLTIYESNLEVEGGKPTNDEDKRMDDGESGLQLRFRELPYSVETEETEMIGMNYVASGSANASAVTSKEKEPARSVESNGKGKRRLIESEEPEIQAEEGTQASEDTLNKEEEEMVAALTTKANAIKMLQSRIDLMTAYLERLPPAFKNGNSNPGDEDADMDSDNTVPSLTVLRQIQALVSRLDLIIPSDKEAFDKEILQETNDVQLVQLLNTIMQSTEKAREVGKTFGIVQQGKIRSHQHGYDPSAGMSSVMDMLT